MRFKQLLALASLPCLAIPAIASANTADATALGFVPKTALTFQDMRDIEDTSVSASGEKWYGSVKAGYVFHSKNNTKIIFL